MRGLTALKSFTILTNHLLPYTHSSIFHSSLSFHKRGNNISATNMSISPLITFKAGICDFDVSGASLFLAFGAEHEIVQEQDDKFFKLIV